MKMPIAAHPSRRYTNTGMLLGPQRKPAPVLATVEGLQPITGGTRVLLAPDGKTLYLGRASLVESFKLAHEKSRVVARSIACHELGALIRHLVIARDGALFAMVAQDGPPDRYPTQIVQITDRGAVVLRSLPARVTAAAATRAHLVVAVAGTDLEPPRLLILRRRDGKVVSREAVSSDTVTLTVGRGEELLIRDGRSKRQRWVDVARRTERCVPRPPEPEPQRPDCPPPRGKPSSCCDCNGTDDGDVPDSSVPQPQPRDPQDTCIPGDTGVPDGCNVTYVQEGWSIIAVNLCEPGAQPCAVRLGWEIDSLARTPRAIVAQSRDRQRVALLDPASLSVIHVHHALRQRVSAIAAANADTVLLVSDSGTVQLLDPTPVLPSLEPNLRLAANSRVFEGQSPAVDWDNDGAARGLYNVLIIPVLEPHQGDFKGSVQSYFDLADMREILDSTVEYYREVSYHNPPDVEGVDLHFRIFGGIPTLYEGPPIKLDKAFQSYWGPGWDPGAIEATVPLPGAGLLLSFSGDERLVLECVPEIRDPLPFDIRFPAASFQARIPAVISLDFGPSVVPPRVFNLDATDRQGNVFGFTVSTAALTGMTTVAISQPTLENGDALEAFADALEAMLQTQPNGALFERPAVRWHNDGEALGMLHVTLSFASGGGSEAPTVTFFDASDLVPEFDLNSNSSLAALFNLTGDEANFALYLRRILADATVDQPDLEGPPGDIRDAYFELKEKNFRPQVDTSGGNLRIRINLSTADGRQPGHIKAPTNQTGLEKIGMHEAQSITGEDVLFSGSGLPTINGDNHQRLVDDVFTKMVDAILEYKTGPQEPKIDDINRYFNCEGTPPYECAFSLLHAFVITSVGQFFGVGATPEPLISDLRGSSRPLSMNDQGTRVKPVVPIGANRSKIVGAWMRFRGIDDPATSAIDEETMPVEEDAATMMHELGHALLGLPDQYEVGTHRRDLRYIEGYDLMGESSSRSHLCAYHKRAKGWLADEAIVVLDRPAGDERIDQQVVLIQLEAWNPQLDKAALSVLAHSLLPGTAAALPEGEPVAVAAAVFLRLGGDGRHFDIVELRGKSARFSQGIDPSRVVITNAIDLGDDTRYAQGEFDEDDIGTSLDVLNRYRRKLHLIDDSLRADSVGTPAATFDFAAAPALPEVGLTVSVEEWGRGSTGTVDFDIARLRIQWKRGAAIDLGFVEAIPTWQSPDIVIFKPDDPFEFPESQSPDERETFRVPEENEGALLHKIGVRVWNFGDADALNVQVELRMRRPGGGGEIEDTYQTQLISPVRPSAPEVVSFDWEVASDIDAHCCFRAQIGDRDIPTQNGLALASDDTNEVNNWAQQNVFRLEAPAQSPPQPVEFSFRVYNDGPFKEEVMLAPRGLGKGARVIVTPADLTIPRKRAGTFRVRVELDEPLLNAACGKDISFVLEAWRKDDHACERWGASKYTIMPRLATQTVLEGDLLPDQLRLLGVVTPDGCRRRQRAAACPVAESAAAVAAGGTRARCDVRFLTAWRLPAKRGGPRDRALRTHLCACEFDVQDAEALVDPARLKHRPDDLRPPRDRASEASIWATEA